MLAELSLLEQCCELTPQTARLLLYAEKRMFLLSLWSYCKFSLFSLAVTRCSKAHPPVLKL